LTRLVSEWLQTTAEEIRAYEAHTRALTGLSPLALAAKGAGLLQGIALTESDARELIQGCRVGIVRVTAGQGTIGGFTESLARLVEGLGAEAFLPDEPDVDGLYRVLEAGCHATLLADDARFLAINLQNGASMENDRATAYGYATALDGMAGGLAGRDVLLLGLGPVGRHAFDALEALGARVHIHDRREEALREHADRAAGIAGRRDIPRFPLILDATNTGAWLTLGDLHPDVRLSSPGLPQSIGEGAEQLQSRIFSDPLQTGAAVMLLGVLTPSTVFRQKAAPG
jgi:pyrrolysine biosynthesis protein PylD